MNIKKLMIGGLSGLGAIVIIAGGAYMTGKATNVPKEVIVVEEKEDKKEEAGESTETSNSSEEYKKISKSNCNEEFLKDAKIVYDITVEDCTKFLTTSERYKQCEIIHTKWQDKELNEDEKYIYFSLWYEGKDGLYRFLPPIMDEVPQTRKAIDKHLPILKNKLGYLFGEV